MNENEKTSKFLVEYFGGCWHEWNEKDDPENVTRDGDGRICIKCGIAIDDPTRSYNSNLFTWPGFGWLWRKCKEQEWWEKFLWETIRSRLYTNYPDDLSACCEVLINPLTFPKRVKEFLEGL